MIKEILNKLDYAEILTQSDPNIHLVKDYLEHGQLYGYYVNNEPVSFAALEIIDGAIEIKNIYTFPEHRGHGYAKALIKFIEETYNNYHTFYLLTTNSSLENITFYSHLGYVYSHRIENFFLDYYPKEIFENQMQATDLVYFKKTLSNLN